jgi:hypothetical protein
VIEHLAQSSLVRIVALGALVDLDAGARSQVRSASGKVTLSRCITKLKMSPPNPHPKQCHVSRPGVTTNDGVFSP